MGELSALSAKNQANGELTECSHHTTYHFNGPVPALPTLHQPAVSDQSEGCKNERFVHNKKL